jgi:hypothetical protein
MRKLSDQEKNRLWEEVTAEFPSDRVMQEVHFARLVHHEMLRGESPETRASFFHEEAGRALGRSEKRGGTVSA